MSPAPKHIELIGQEVAVAWPDGAEHFLPMEFLRAASPSADNKGEPDLFGNMHGASGQTEFPGVRVLTWQPVGGYAVQFHFSDGHKTGLYTFDYLRRLGESRAEG